MTDHTEAPDQVHEYGRTVAERMQRRVSINVPFRHNPRLRQFIERVNEDDDLYGLWLAANVNAIERLGMTDHGPVHVKIVMNIALKLLRLLIDARRGAVGRHATTRWRPTTPRWWSRWPRCCTTWACRSTATDHENFSLFVAQRQARATCWPPVYDCPPRPSCAPRSCTRSSRTAPVARRSRWKPAWFASPTRSTWRRAAHASRSRRDRQHPLDLRGGDRSGHDRGGSQTSRSGCASRCPTRRACSSSISSSARSSPAAASRAVHRAGSAHRRRGRETALPGVSPLTLGERANGRTGDRMIGIRPLVRPFACQ